MTLIDFSFGILLNTVVKVTFIDLYDVCPFYNWFLHQ